MITALADRSNLFRFPSRSSASRFARIIAICGTLFAVGATHAVEKPNVVVIFADDLGYGDLSCYGASKLKTPNIDRLASEGRRFTDAHSASAVCTPSRYALITGRYPFRRGLSKPVFLKTGLVVDQERTTIADVMKNAGYATACVGKWHLGFGEKTPNWNGELKPGPLELGFDYYYGVPTVNSHPPFVYVENHRVVGLVPEDPFVYGKKAKTRAIHEKMAIDQIGGADAAHRLYDDYAVGTNLAEKSVEWITANKEKPFFLYLSTTNIHHPFTPAKRFRGTSECGLYGDFVHELDWIVGEVMATLEKNGLAENTLVIFTSDNGGMINETGQEAIKQGHQLNGNLLGFKFDAWEGGHRVPFIARWSGKVEAGSVSDQLVCNVDLMAAMAALTKQELKNEEAPDSFDILPALIGDPVKPIREEVVLAAMRGTHLTLRQENWAYIGAKGGGGFGSQKVGTHGFGGPAAIHFAGQTNSDIVNGKLKSDAPPGQLYNLSTDRSQTDNVIQRESERAEAMRARLDEIKAGSTTRPVGGSGGSAHRAAPAAEEAGELAHLQSFVAKHCRECHGEKKQKGDVRLDDISRLDAEVWALVFEQIASEEMPPDDELQPTEAERIAFKDHALALANAEGATLVTGFRRLNKREYGNTVRDLLGLGKGTFDPAEYIYEDEIDEGFDTRAESLVISNELLLEYMGAARKSLQHALFSDEVEKPESIRTVVDLKKVTGTSRRYINNHKDHVIGRSGGKAKLLSGDKDRAMEFPGRYKITVTASGVDREFYPIRFAPEQGPLVMGFGIIPEGKESLSGKGVLQRTFELKDDVEQTFQFDTWIDKGHSPYFTFENGSSKPITQIRSNIRRRKIPASAMKSLFRGPGIKITQFIIEGPFHDEWPPLSFRTTFDSGTIPGLEVDEEREALIHRFAERAFRRAVTAAEIQPYLDFLNRKHAANKDWHIAVLETFAAMMASHDFLYIRNRFSTSEEGAIDGLAGLDHQNALGSYELASRLSYFLWSTMPDEDLFALAESGKILEPEVLRKQVERMLNSPQAGAFSESFTDQWLSLDTLGSMPPDTKNPQFKAYHRNKLESSMLEETRRFFAHILRGNRSVRDFIDSDYSFLNAGLAELYGIPFDGEDGFVRVTFPGDVKRGGLLGQGSILTLTSNGVETSPVVRGHWVLDELLGSPPPPAPKEVPALVPDLNGATTVRDQLEKHRSEPACYECHKEMDPLGFSLEAYDPIGRLRTEYENKQPVTTFGSYKGVDFDGVEDLKKIMLNDIRPFARSLTFKIAEYAKGRELTVADFSALEEIVDSSAVGDFRLKDLVLKIATSKLMTER